MCICAKYVLFFSYHMVWLVMSFNPTWSERSCCNREHTDKMVCQVQDALHKACSAGDLRQTEQLIREGAHIMARNKVMFTHLRNHKRKHMPIQTNTNCLCADLTASVCTETLQSEGTCLMSACEGGHLDVVKYVCEIGGKELVMATDWVSYLN